MTDTTDRINAPESAENTAAHVTADEIRARLPEDVIFAKTAVFFKALCDETRLKLIWALDQSSEMCVNDIADALGMSPSAISHSLSTLKIANLVTPRRQGKEIFYSLADDHVRSMLEAGLEHTQE